MIYFLVFLIVSPFIDGSPTGSMKGVDLPSFLESLTNLRSELVDLIGPLDSKETNEKDSGAPDLTAGSIFDEKRKKCIFCRFSQF